MATEIERRAKELIEAGEYTYYVRGVGDCCVFCDEVDTYEEPINHDEDCPWRALLGAVVAKWPEVLDA